MSLSELVNDKVRIVATEIVEEHWDFIADWALQVTLAVGGANKPPRDVVVIRDFGTVRLAFYELVTADVAPSGIIIFRPAGGHLGASSPDSSEESPRSRLPKR